MSSGEIPEEYRSVVVGCYECHGQAPASHKDRFEHFSYDIHVVVTPNDCKTCHALEVEQYSGSKKAHALPNLRANPIYHLLVDTIDGVKEVKDGKLVHVDATEHTKGETCYACHGTEVGVKGLKEVSTDLGILELPDLTNWPNQGVGRINPDGSQGSCSSCHARHGFSIEVARKPYTCAECHLHPDIPAWEVYKESKHGNIYLSKGSGWNWDRVPWTVGEDFRAPTCATCHNSLVVKSNGDTVVSRSHDFGARLWTRIFGLIYSHPQPKEGKTHIIKNKDGLPLPTTFTGTPASEFLISGEEQGKRRRMLAGVCKSCHGTSWVDSHLAQLDRTIEETDKMVLSATKLMQMGWKRGMADQSNPFDETMEQKWIAQWLFYANSVRFASAMSGADYATFKNGWWEFTKNIQELGSDLAK